MHEFIINEKIKRAAEWREDILRKFSEEDLERATALLCELADYFNHLEQHSKVKAFCDAVKCLPGTMKNLPEYL